MERRAYQLCICIKKGSNNFFTVDAVTSNEFGVTLGWSWTQSSHTVNVSGNIITVDIYGTENYNIILEGIGTVYKSPQHYRMTLDKLTGKQLTLEKI